MNIWKRKAASERVLADERVPDSYPFRSRDVALVVVHEGLAEVVFAARPSGATRVLTLTVEAAIELQRQLGAATSQGIAA